MHDPRQPNSGAPAPSRPALRLPAMASPVESLSDLERALKPRTSVPSQRYARFLALSDEGLAAAAVTTRHAAEHLRRVLQDLRGRSRHVDAVLGSIAPTFFSEDHGWRAIFRELLAAGPGYTDYKLLALADYRRYLLHCLDALNQVSTDRLQSTLCLEAHVLEEESTVFTDDARGAAAPVTTRSEVLVRDLVRLPRGTTARLRQGRDGPLELWLGARRFRIETWSGASLVDEHGRGVTLREGRNLVGRGLYNDVIVDARYTDVSRRHLILDIREGVPSAVTDLSSAGTFLSRALVDQAAA